jgi:hypothetical protein
LTRIAEPSGSMRMMMLPNSSGSDSRPLVVTVYWNCWSVGAGGAPICPAGTCTFCSATAFWMSATLTLSEVMRSGLSQKRMP